MQIVSTGDNLHDMSNPVFWENRTKKNIINMSSAELAQLWWRLTQINKMRDNCKQQGFYN